MDRDPRSNRDVPTTPLAPSGGGGVATAPAPSPARPRARRGALNPWYFVLIGGIPLLVVAVMLLAVSGVFPPRNDVVLATPTPVWDQVSRLQIQKSTPQPAPDLGPGWYTVQGQITNGSDFDLTNVNLRAFLYDQDGTLIGSGITDTRHLKHGDTIQYLIRAQVISGPAPKADQTPTPAPLIWQSGWPYDVKIIAVVPQPTPAPGGTPSK